MDYEGGLLRTLVANFQGWPHAQLQSRSFVVPMVEKEGERQNLERLCLGVSPGDAACNYPATVHCPTCDGRRP